MAEAVLLIDILVRKIDAPRKSHLAVDDQYLPMIPIIVVGRKDRPDRREHLTADALVLHELRKKTGKVEQYIGAVIHEPHLHTLLRLFPQNLQNRVQHPALMDDEELQKNEFLGLSQLLHHIHELAVPQGVILHLRILIHRTVVPPLQIISQLPHVRAFLPQPPSGQGP